MFEVYIFVYFGIMYVVVNPVAYSEYKKGKNAFFIFFCEKREIHNLYFNRTMKVLIG